ncbi:MAG: CPXCG motif-containing cysteine-rich protein [Limisphaerales bacterium]
MGNESELTNFFQGLSPQQIWNYSTVVEPLHFGRARLDLCMEEFETIQCPFCGQSFETAIDTSVASQRFTTDCEICCRPFEIVAECESGEILSLDVSGN